MSTRALGFLQWFGILAGALTWTAQHVVGYGVGEAACRAGGMHWHLAYDAAQWTLLSVACAVFLVAETSAALVFLATRDAGFGDGPPENDGLWEVAARRGRMHFFATAALVSNVLFVAIPLLSGLGGIFSVLCRQS